MSCHLAAPVAFFLYNRPDTTRQVFARIAEARPQTLLLVADGPRADRPDDRQRCEQARAVVEQINWPCHVLRNYAEANLGCKKRVSSGLDWVFSRVDRAIVLEDDVLPHPTLFRFFDEMLEHYRDDERIGMISGFNPLGQWKSDRQQYHFTYCGSIWGWASWRRAWRWYDVEMRLWADPKVRQRIRDLFAEPELYEGRMQAYDRVYRGEVDTWDFQWSVARLARSALSVAPAVNLVRNLGFRADGTHTRKPHPVVDAVPVLPMTFPIRFHDRVAVDREYDLAFTGALK